MRSALVASVVAFCAGGSIAHAGMAAISREFTVTGQLNLRVDGLPDVDGPTYFQVLVGPTGQVVGINRGLADHVYGPWDADDMLEDIVANPLFVGAGPGFEPLYESSTMRITMPAVVGDETPDGNTQYDVRMGGDIYFDFATQVYTLRGTGTSNLGWHWGSTTRVGDSDFTAVLQSPITLAWSELVVGLPTITIEPDSYLHYKLVPTPGAACVLAGAGLMGFRRRR